MSLSLCFFCKTKIITGILVPLNIFSGNDIIASIYPFSTKYLRRLCSLIVFLNKKPCGNITDIFPPSCTLSNIFTINLE